MDIRVIKLGGSLLKSGHLRGCVQRWCARQSRMVSLWVVGGGAMVDVIREWDDRFQLDAAVSHMLAIQAMAINARLLTALLPDLTWVEDARKFRERQHGAEVAGVLDPLAFMSTAGTVDRALDVPPSWSVTSDSIAALAARCVDARELVLLKSCLPQAKPPVVLPHAAEIGYVDACFPRAAAPLRCIRAVNFRDAEFAEVRIQ